MIIRYLDPWSMLAAGGAGWQPRQRHRDAAGCYKHSPPQGGSAVVLHISASVS